MHNFIVIVLTLALLALMGFSLKLLFDKGIFPYTKKISAFVARKLKWKYWVILLESFFIIVSISSFILLIMENNLQYIPFVHLILILFLSALIYQLRKLQPNC